MDVDRIRALIAELQALLGDAGVQAVVGPDEVLLSRTGNVYPRPRADLGETFIGYVQRVGAATARNTSAVGSLFLGTGHLGDAGDPANWPEMADRYFNPRAYMDESQRAAEDAGKALWAAWQPPMHAPIQHQPPKPPKPQPPAGEQDVPINQE